MEQKQLESLTGSIEEIIFRNEDTGFTVLLLAADEEPVTVVGEVLDIAVGEEVTVTGRFVTHGTYGTQFKAETFQRLLPSNAAAIAKYLASGAIKGVGPVLAGRLVAKFGDQTLEVIENEPRRLAQVQGISPQKAASIGGEFKRIFGIRSVMLFLEGFQVDPSAAIRVWKLWGSLAADVIRQDPYCLCCDEVGLGFERADEIATRLGLAPESILRVRAGLLHVLRHNARNGHVCLPREKLLEVAAGFLEQPGELLDEVLADQLAEGNLHLYQNGQASHVYLPEYFFAESYIAGRVGLMLRLDCPLKPDYSAELDKLEQRLGIQYAALQRRAAAQALGSSIFILTGGPGTGKTTTLNGILQLLEQQKLKVALAAPTGRAAKRLSEVTGREAKTIHRLLEVDPASPRHAFKRNEKNPLPCGALIVDEMSMVDSLLFESLLRATRQSCKLILVGDPDQLPSVGAGNLLRDLIASDLVPTVHLSEVFRQAADSLIVTNAHAIVRGELPNLTRRDSDFFFMHRQNLESAAQTVVDLCCRRLPARYELSPMWDIQVIVPGRKGLLGTEQLNPLLQQALNPPAPGKVEHTALGRTLREGDKVMQVRNNYDAVWSSGELEGMGVFNGDIGIIEMIDRPSSTVLIRFDDKTVAYSFDMLDEIEHAYAITIHKSQGCEFEAVVMPLAGYHPRLHYRNLLYTGVTRAKRLLVVPGHAQTIAGMVGNNKRTLRYTNLKAMLADERGAPGELL